MSAYSFSLLNPKEFGWGDRSSEGSGGGSVDLLGDFTWDVGDRPIVNTNMEINNFQDFQQYVNEISGFRSAWTDPIDVEVGKTYELLMDVSSFVNTPNFRITAWQNDTGSGAGEYVYTSDGSNTPGLLGGTFIPTVASIVVGIRMIFVSPIASVRAVDMSLIKVS
jgi:hypothetical protein